MCAIAWGEDCLRGGVRSLSEFLRSLRILLVGDCFKRFDRCIDTPVSKHPQAVANNSKVQTIRREAKKHSAPVFVGLVAWLVAWLGRLLGWMDVWSDQKVLLSS